MHTRHVRHRSYKARLRLEALERRELLAAEILISEFLASNDDGLVDGLSRTSDWIEIYNAGDTSQDIGGWHLTDNVANPTLWTIPVAPETNLAPGDFLVIFASGDGVPDPSGQLHTNFGLSASGEYLALLRDDLSIASEFAPEYPPQRSDISFGIDPSVVSGSQERFFLTPTPGAANGIGLQGFVDDTSFSVDRGFFQQAFSVDITSSTPGSTIVYTTDGSAPSATNGTQVTAGSGVTPTATVNITTTTTLRAIALKDGFQPTNVDTQTYLFLNDVLSQSNSPAGFPTQWGSAPAADYELDPEIVNNASYTTDLLQGLSELPSLTIAGDVDEIFGPGGIYSNPTNSNLETAISAEYILPDGSTGFQVDAGLKVAGGASRNPNNSPKHSLSLRFRGEYGASRLEYPLFEDSPISNFNSLQLRAMYNNSWIHWDQGQRSRGTLIRDQFIRDSLLAAGQDDAGRGHYTHLYLNGLYWGVYNLHERADTTHFANYNGGDPDSFDSLNGGSPTSGTLNSWDNVKSVVAAGNWESVQAVLDVDNFIDWTLANAYGGNADLKTNGNWRAAGGGTGDGLWRMYAWDSERIFEGVTQRAPNQITDATGLYADLLQIPEFVVRMGDRIQKHFFNDGVFTPQRAADRWNARASQLTNAIVAESARWGDYRRDVHPRGATPLLYQRDLHWTPETNRLLSAYFPDRTDFVVNAYENLGVFPNVSAPIFQINGVAQSGGQVAAGSELRLTASEALYYTLDSNDPRETDGSISPDAILYDPTIGQTTPLADGAAWKYHDQGVDLGTSWRDPSFDDSTWPSGNAELGFGDGDETTVVSFGGDPNNKHLTTYFRTTFDVPSSGTTLATLRLKRDDGAAAYLNGIEIARDNMPAGLISYGSRALQAASDDGQVWQEFTFDPAFLNVGTNTLAVEIHQNQNGSSDLSFDAEVILTTQTEPPLVLNETTQIIARARDSSGAWSALHDALFLVPNVPATADNLRVTEINYAPSIDGDAEFIELKNISSGESGVTIDLDGITLTDGPSSPLTLPINTTLAPGEFGLLVRDTTAFLAAYPSVPPEQILGEYAGKLSNSGERIRITDASGIEIIDLDYSDDDPWPEWADGRGGTLVLHQPNTVPAGESGKPYHWRDSVALGGSPGTPATAPDGILINEVLAHTDAPLIDTIELYNPTNASIDIGGWFLSDSGATLQKFQIPGSTILAAGGYITFDETDFNPTVPGPNNLFSFALSASQGDSVWLSKPMGAVPALVDHVSFDATFNGSSLGRLADSGGRLVPLANRSLGMLNGTFAVSDVYLSEVNYHPAPPSAAATAILPSLSENDLEFIELANRSASSVDLSNWRLRGEGDHDFSVGDQLDSGKALVVVSFDPTDPNNSDLRNAFRTHYGIDASVELVGPFTGTLSNSHGLVRLLRPDAPPQDAPDVTPSVLVDELYYDDLSPWPTDADGAGQTLQRTAASSLGVHAASWRGEPASPGNQPDRPLVESVTINDGTSSRSQVTQIQVQFDREVNVSASAFEIMDRNSQSLVSGLLVSNTIVNGKTVSQITFESGAFVQHRDNSANSLVDGNFQLRVISTEVTAATTSAGMQSDHLFGDEASDAFFRLFGDTDGDRDVDGQDYGRFGLTFLKTSSQQDFNEQLDFDNDGDVDGQDYGNFGLRFLQSLSF